MSDIMKYWKLKWKFSNLLRRIKYFLFRKPLIVNLVVYQEKLYGLLDDGTIREIKNL